LIDIKITISKMVPSITEQKGNNPLPALPNNSTYYYNKQLLRVGAFADCTVTCKGRSWPAHRNILSPRCDFFKCCFDGRFSEGQARVIAMDDDDVVAVDGMLYYLYTLEYPTQIYQKLLGAETGSGSDSGIEDEDSTGQNAQVYWGFDLLVFTIADKYGLTGLRELAGQSLLIKADLVGKGQELLKNVDGFVTLIEDLYTTQDMSDQLREVRTQVVDSTCEPITHHVRDERISALMADIPEFAIELVEVLGKKKDERRLLQREEEERREATRVRLTHIPMNDDSDCDD
jgi:speckle-type POZ protein